VLALHPLHTLVMPLAPISRFVAAIKLWWRRWWFWWRWRWRWWCDALADEVRVHPQLDKALGK
jgi:hypothetical protein